MLGGKNGKRPAIVWLKMTDYMHAWLQWELGGSLRVKDQRVISVQHLPGAREILRMETAEASSSSRKVGGAMSAAWRNAIEAGLMFDPQSIKHEYGLTAESVRMYIPMECPKMYLTESGVLRPWTDNINLSQKQAYAMQSLLRQAFWSAVDEFAAEYARKHEGEKYAQVEMIEDFCALTKTSDLYVDAMRREWHRRQKRSCAQKSC